MTPIRCHTCGTVSEPRATCLICAGPMVASDEHAPVTRTDDYARYQCHDDAMPALLRRQCS